MDHPTQPLPLYQGYFGQYSITPADRQGVRLYRLGLLLSALAFAVGAGLGLASAARADLVSLIDGCYLVFWLGLGLSLATIHIYMISLHRLLQVCWGVGGLASLAIAWTAQAPLAQTLVSYPQTLWGIGLTFVALTGLYVKEAFCFHRLETKLLTPLVPLTLLGHLSGWAPIPIKQGLLGVWALLFLFFAAGKLTQPLTPDIGDKSVFENLKKKPPGPTPTELSG
ncbi:MAG: hypothetical protein KGQ93_02655 [Cyanobacteria bacterium REEB459]|nr:hypothetical protein [Cyanobacteria bacterium REEB459]